MILHYELKNPRGNKVISQGDFEWDETLMNLLRLMGSLIKSATTPCTIIIKDDVMDEIWRIGLSNMYQSWSIKEINPLSSIVADGHILFDKKIVVKVDPQTNLNKYEQYELNNKDDHQIGSIKRGRVEETAVKSSVKAYMLPIQYMVSLKNGYKPTSMLPSKKSMNRSKKSDIKDFLKEPNDEVKRLILFLYSVSRQILEENYSIDIDIVDKDDVKKAQNLINGLRKANTVEIFNEKLLLLYTAIPRAIKNVKRCMVNSVNDFEACIDHEQELLDMLIAQIDNTDEDEISTWTTMQHYGFSLKPVSDISVIQMIKSKLSGSQKKLVNRIFEVNCPWQEKRFKEFCTSENVKDEDCKLLWHGSRNENFLSILKSGLTLYPDAFCTGKMFGNGIYFAPDSDKSFNYTSFQGSYWVKGDSDIAYMLLCNTAYGNPCMRTKDGSLYSAEDTVKYSNGTYQCFHATRGSFGLLRDEIIFYDEAAITPRYFVEFKTK